MKLKELQNLLDSQPSVSGSTILVGILFVVSCILTLFFFILGIGLLLESFFEFKIFLDWVSKQLRLVLNIEQRQQIATSFGLFSLILALVFGSFIYLCRMILRRNHFIIQMEDWIYGNLSEIKRTIKKTTRK